ncbi:CoB--CoM heterodisulfide reductase iron-sulfur subunit B family protein [Desulfosediminicola ganghwensis]|uniref:CoB--CoM heterodisulfide reductase iron-sulfur subunit B family protein n=1 Tax=Desulfosediminicola ganghwensis TaxID=2569540 RepID=UPI0010AC6C9D|nr:CoB--CoM heterodisulfide reductase iron-sulfur subunit B family protein [Desulfosediminicola ganghwensis]
MKYAFFQGCNIPIRIQQYATATEAVLKVFDVELHVENDFNCCGYPMRNVDEKSYILPSARNLALAEKACLDIMVLCNCCFQSLKKAQHVLANDEALAAELNEVLAREGLEYTGKTQVQHFLTILHDQIGIDTIKSKLHYRYTKLDCAVIHGCHLLRPRKITNFDDSFVPAITDSLMQAAGAKSIDWQGRLECCGAALAGINDELANSLLDEKIKGAQAAGVDFIVPICAYCYLQCDIAQVNNLKKQPDKATDTPFPVLLYPQLLGLCLGLPPTTLGLPDNQTISSDDIDSLQSLLGPPVEPKKSRKKVKTTT